MKIEFLLPSFVKNFLPNGTPPVVDLSFVNIAYRKKPEGAATGGPNGVLAVKQSLLGNMYRGLYLRYAYEPKVWELPETLALFAKQQRLGTMTKNLLSAYHFVQNSLQASLPKPFSARPGAVYHLICHDIGSAAAAHMNGMPFTLIYHQQGSFVHERTSFGEQLNEAERYLMNTFEKLAFEKADRVYFPSAGAKEAFCSTTESVSLEKVSFGSHPIYNSVVDFSVDSSSMKAFLIEHGLWSLLIPAIRKNYQVFISVGDYTENKGIDRVPEMLTQIAKSSTKKIVWICMGSKHKSGIFEKFEARKHDWPFRAILIPSRQNHALTMALIQFADWKIMMQRHSIFDFSTLETMKLGTGVILSPVGGNIEFNKDNNIIYLDPESGDSDQFSKVVAADPVMYGEKNKDVFSKYFSPEIFRDSYLKLYDDIIERTLAPTHIAGVVGARDRLLEIFSNREVVICGPGASLNRLTPSDYEGKVLVALNSGLLHELPYEAHIMQDEPKDPTAWIEYFSKDVERIYGKINRLSTKELGINFEILDENHINYLEYNLSSTVFDERYDDLSFSIGEQPILDMSGVLFSAIQLAVGSGAIGIELAGVDFSTTNFNSANGNLYNQSTYINLAAMARALNRQGIPFRALHTDSEYVREILEKKGDGGIPVMEVTVNKNHISAVKKTPKKTFKMRLNEAGPVKRAILIIGDKLLPDPIAKPIDRFLQRHRVL